MESIDFKRPYDRNKEIRRTQTLGDVSQKVLPAQLRDMEENGRISRKVYAEVPPRVEYSLTPLGESLSPILSAMKNWGENFKETLIR